MNQSSGGIPVWGWIVGAVVVVGVIWYAMSPKKKVAYLDNPMQIVQVQNAPSLVPA